jgi:hypothetical protein
MAGRAATEGLVLKGTQKLAGIMQACEHRKPVQMGIGQGEPCGPGEPRPGEAPPSHQPKG